MNTPRDAPVRVIFKLFLPLTVLFGLYLAVEAPLGAAGGVAGGLAIAGATACHQAVFGREEAHRAAPAQAWRSLLALGVISLAVAAFGPMFAGAPLLTSAGIGQAAAGAYAHAPLWFLEIGMLAVTAGAGGLLVQSLGAES